MAGGKEVALSRGGVWGRETDLRLDLQATLVRKDAEWLAAAWMVRLVVRRRCDVSPGMPRMAQVETAGDMDVRLVPFMGCPEGACIWWSVEALAFGVGGIQRCQRGNRSLDRMAGAYGI